MVDGPDWAREATRRPVADDLAVAVAAAAPHDVVVLPAGAVLTPGGLERLRAAALSDDGIATASPLAGDPAADERVAAAAPRIRPRLPDGPGDCVYLRRHAIDLAGGVGGSVAAFATACSELGLQHVLADDVVAGGVDGPPEAGTTPAIARARRAARIAADGLTVTIDGRCLKGDRVTGTEVHVLEVVAAIARTGAATVRVLLPPDPGPGALSAIEGVASAELLPYASLDEAMERSHVVHRPYQVTSDEDLSILRLVADRIVVTNQDLIAYRVPGYHVDVPAWQAYRRLTRQALALADLVVFESGHALADAQADDLVEPGRSRLVPVGVDHRVLGADAVAERPREVGDRPFLLVLGSNYRHKNHGFALRLRDALRERHGWEGEVVFAGPEVQPGGESPDGGVRLGAVTEGQKAWLLAHAAAVAYPTIYEGFGLIPFEAAAAGTPCLWASVASLADHLPRDLAAIVPWDAEASADRARPLLEPGPARQAHVARVRALAAELTWDRAAEELLEVYREAATLPARDAAVAAADALAAEMARGAWEGRYWHLRNEIGPAGLALVGPETPLLDEDDRRALAALAGRPAGRRLLRAALRAAARAGRRTG